MAADNFIEIQECPGESEDKQHKGKIEVLSWSWGLNNAASMHISGGGGVSKANAQDFHFTMYQGKPSAELIRRCSNGKHFPKATLYCRKSGGAQYDYLLITMEDIIVTGVSFGASGGDHPPVDNVSLQFAKVKIEYKAQDKSGKVTNAGNVTWDIKAATTT
jgi:type VI secretion system secreted protein Hcp